MVLQYYKKQNSINLLKKPSDHTFGNNTHYMHLSMSVLLADMLAASLTCTKYLYWNLLEYSGNRMG